MLEKIPNIGEEVKYGGGRYIAVDRGAEVGEKVIVVEDFCYGKRGEVHEITEISSELHAYVTDKAELMNYDRCLVLEPSVRFKREGVSLGPAEIAIDGVKYMGVISEAYDDGGDLSINVSSMVPAEKESESSKPPQTDRDLIIELAYTVSQLKGEIEELRGLTMKTDEKAEMLIDDIVTLDERTQPLTDDGAKEFAEGLSDVIEDYVNDRINSEQIRRVYE